MGFNRAKLNLVLTTDSVNLGPNYPLIQSPNNHGHLSKPIDHQESNNFVSGARIRIQAKYAKFWTRSQALRRLPPARCCGRVVAMHELSAPPPLPRALLSPCLDMECPSLSPPPSLISYPSHLLSLSNHGRAVTAIAEQSHCRRSSASHACRPS